MDGAKTISAERAFGELLRLHEDVDREASALADLHRDRLQCARGCAGCCVDGISVHDIEAERIRRGAAELLAGGRPREPGACVFLGSHGECRIYEHRPYVCRTQGLPLRWLETGPAGSLVELRDICTLNESGTPVQSLPAESCWTIGAVEARLAALQRHWSGPGVRVSLRDLFGPASEVQAHGTGGGSSE